MPNAERGNESPKFHQYVEVQSFEEGLFKVLKDYVDGKLNYEDLLEMAEIYLNAFPPFAYFLGRSGSERYLLEQMEGINSLTEFSHSELCAEIMRHSTVVDRFKKAAPNAGPVPAHLPEKSRITAKSPEHGSKWQVGTRRLALAAILGIATGVIVYRHQAQTIEAKMEGIDITQATIGDDRAIDLAKQALADHAARIGKKPEVIVRSYVFRPGDINWDSVFARSILDSPVAHSTLPEKTVVAYLVVKSSIDGAEVGRVIALDSATGRFISMNQDN